MNVVGLLILLLVLIGAAALLGAVVQSVLPVSVERAAVFVERTGVALTADNAGYVVDAIARTRRWRAAALLVTVSACVAWDVVAGTATFTTITGVAIGAAILVGTIVGERRNVSVRGDGRRSAALVARSPSQYVGPWASRWPAAVAGASLALLALDLMVSDERVATLVIAAISVGSWWLARTTSRYVVDRPRPTGAGPDVLAADDGLRSRALHSIAGTAFFAGGWAAVALAVTPLANSDPQQSNDGLALLAWTAMLVIAVVAWRWGSAAFPVASGTSDPAAVAGAEDGATT